MRHRIRASFSEIFPDEEKKELSEYLSGINPDQLRQIVLNLISVTNYNSEWNDWGKLLFKHWFHGENLALAEYIYQRVSIMKSTNYKHLGEGNYILLTKTCVLTLLESTFKIKYDGEKKTELAIEIDLFKSLLIINEMLGPKGDFPIVEKELRHVLNRDIISSLVLGFGQVINNNNLNYFEFLFACQLGKALYLFEFLELRNSDILKKFNERYKCENSNVYIENLYRIIKAMLFEKNNEPDSNSRFFSVNVRTEAYKLKSFVQELSINSKVIKDDDIDFSQLRSRPLIEYEEDIYAVSNETFLIQKLYDSVYFDLKDLSSEIFDNKSNFRTYFTDEFSEKTLTYGLLEKIYNKKSYKRLNGEEIAKVMEGGPDYYIRNGNKIFLFESKDNLMSGKEKSSPKFEKIIKFIDERFVKKGIKQLINNIESIFNKKYKKFDNNYNEKNCNIYPIIVVHRIEFDNAGLNIYLKHKFIEEINKLKEKGYNTSKVKELTLVNIDAFIVYCKLMQEGKLNLDTCIDKYHSAINKEIINYKSESELERKKALKSASFYTYMNYFYSVENKINLNEQLHFIRKEVIGKIQT